MARKLIYLPPLTVLETRRHHALLPFGVALLIASITAASATAVTTFTTATAATLFLLLALRGCGDIGGAWHRVGVGLGGGICHG